MENKILRLVIVRDLENNVLGFVALRNNGTSKYGFGEDINSKKNCMNKLMNELVKTYPNGLTELVKNKDVKGIMDALRENGYLLEQKNDIITKITVVENGENSYFEVQYAVQKPITYKLKELDNNKYNELLDEYLEKMEKEYRISNALDKNLDMVKVISIKKKEEVDSYDDYDADYDDDYDIELNDSDKSANKKNIKIFKRAIALITAGATLALVGTGIYKLGKKNGNNEVNNTNYYVEETHQMNLSTPTPTPFVVVTPTPTIKPTKRPTVKPTKRPTVRPTSIPTPIPTREPLITQEELALEPAPYELRTPSFDNNEVFTYIMSDGGEDSRTINDVNISELDANKRRFFEISNVNLSDLAYFASNGLNPLENYDSLGETPMRIHFEKFISGLNPSDKAALKYFSDLNNDIIYLGYSLGDLEEARSVNRRVVREMIRCIKFNNPLRITVGGQETFVRFNDLGYEAQEAIESICFGNYCLLGTDEIEFAGEYYNQSQVGLDIFGLQQEETPNF